jgi:hypothetical protein
MFVYFLTLKQSNMTPFGTLQGYLKRILVSVDNQHALSSLRALSSVSFLVQLHKSPETPEEYKRFALLLLLTIARRSRVPEQVHEAYRALCKLGIVSEDDLTYTSHDICKCTDHVPCMCIAYNRKIKELHDQADPKKFWENKMFMWLLWLVENYDNECRPKDIRDGSSAAMDEAFLKVRCSLFMLDFMSFWTDCRSLAYLAKFLEDFIEISVDIHRSMNPQYAVKQSNEEESYDTGRGECGGCDNCNTPEKMFLKEHRVRFTHIQTVLQQKLSKTTKHAEKEIIQTMLDDVNKLDTLLHTNSPSTKVVNDY